MVGTFASRLRDVSRSPFPSWRLRLVVAFLKLRFVAIQLLPVQERFFSTYNFRRIRIPETRRILFLIIRDQGGLIFIGASETLQRSDGCSSRKSPNTPDNARTIQSLRCDLISPHNMDKSEAALFSVAQKTARLPLGSHNAQKVHDVIHLSWFHQRLLQGC